MALVRGPVQRRRDRRDAPVAGVRLEAAADAAVAAGRGDVAVHGSRLDHCKQRDLRDRVGRAGVGAGAARDARRLAEALVQAGGDVRARSRGRSPSARTCPGPRRTRARSARTRCTARGAARGRGGAGPARASCTAPGQRSCVAVDAEPARDRARARCPAPAARAARTARARPSPRRSGARSRRSCRRPSRRGTASCTRRAAPGAPATPTMHTRHAPNGSWRASKHSVGTSPPAARTASSTVVPGSTSTARPSTRSASCEPQLVGEVREQAADRRRHAAAVRAQRAELERLEQRFELVAVDRRVARRTCSCARRRPMRHGKHLPQLSSAPKCSRCAASARMSVVSSNATIPPWPSMQPTAASSSKSNGVSSSDAGRIPPSGPPICSALIACPSRRPPARSSHSSRIVSAERAPRRRPGARSAR